MAVPYEGADTDHVRDAERIEEHTADALKSRVVAKGIRLESPKAGMAQATGR